MNRQLIALGLGLAIASSTTAASAQGIQFRYMGDMTCGGWRAAPANLDDVRKAALMNFVLGFLSGRSAERGDDLLAAVEISSIKAWMDDYCAANPLGSVVTGAFELEKVLIARRERAR